MYMKCMIPKKDLDWNKVEMDLENIIVYYKKIMA